MRRASRTDENHQAIREAFRKMGFAVADTAKQGEGYPDLTISRDHVTALVEIKRDKKAELTPDQTVFHQGWKGHIFVVTSVEDAVNVNLHMRREAALRAESVQRRTMAD